MGKLTVAQIRALKEPGRYSDGDGLILEFTRPGLLVRASPAQQLPGWFAHYNDVHPHRALRYRSPREFIAQTREALSGL